MPINRLDLSSDIKKDLYVAIRESVCAFLCPGGRKCLNSKCRNYFLGLVEEVEKKLEEEINADNKR